MRVLHNFSKEVIDVIRQLGYEVNELNPQDGIDRYINLPNWFKLEGDIVFDIPLEELPNSVRYLNYNSQLTKDAAVGFSDWQRTLVFTENDGWLKEKTTKELYDLYLETFR